MAQSNTQNRDLLATNGPPKVKDVDFPLDKQNCHLSMKFLCRKLENGEVLKQCWLLYSESTNLAFCFCCKLFDLNPKSSLAFEGAKWLEAHTSDSHVSWKVHSHFNSFQTWVKAEQRLKLDNCIDMELQHVIQQETKQWEKVIKRLMSIILYLSKNNMAFRGSSDRLFTGTTGTSWVWWRY